MTKPPVKEVQTVLSCPIGEHLVRAHVVNKRPTKKNPNGSIIQRRAHCARNPGKKDILSFEELICISEAFEVLVAGQQLNVLAQFKGRSEKYDILILGWVQYWNEVFKPIEPLDPNLIKALMAIESSFNEDPQPRPYINNQGYARGLLQIMDQTLTILNDDKGELSNYLLKMTTDELMTPSGNICAGVRWLFQKKKLTDRKLKRDATWKEAVANYKGYLKDILSGKNPNPKGMDALQKLYPPFRDTK